MAQTHLVEVALAQHTHFAMSCACIILLHIAMYYCVTGLIFIVGSAPEDIREYPAEGQYPTTTLSGKQNPLVHSNTIPLSRFCSLLPH